MNDRATRVDEAVRGRELDVLLVMDPANLRWLTGFTGSNGAALVGPGIRRFLTDFRYLTQAGEQVPDEWGQAEISSDLLEHVAEGLVAPDGDDPLRLGYEDDHLSVRQLAKLSELVAEWAEPIAAGGIVEELRLVKNEDEVAMIRAAARLADEAFREVVLEGGIVGRTERDVALDLEFAMRRRGASGPSFPPIVAAGEHGALPHAEPRDVPIPADTLVVIDWGAMKDGYASDCTRTVATGDVDPRDREIYDLVFRAQAEALAAVRPGPTGAEVDAIARAIIDEAGHAEHFGHGLGHGVGLEVHENPRLSKTGDSPLAAGNVVTVEPGVYVPGHVGVRIEDLVAITPDGTDVLSSLPKELQTVR